MDWTWHPVTAVRVFLDIGETYLNKLYSPFFPDPLPTGRFRRFVTTFVRVREPPRLKPVRESDRLEGGRVCLR